MPSLRRPSCTGQMLDALIELVAFEGNEFYVTPASPLVHGMKFKQLQVRSAFGLSAEANALLPNAYCHALTPTRTSVSQAVFPNSVPAGVRRGGKFTLRPPADLVVEEGATKVHQT